MAGCAHQLRTVDVSLAKGKRVFSIRIFDKNGCDVLIVCFANIQLELHTLAESFLTPFTCCENGGSCVP